MGYDLLVVGNGAIGHAAALAVSQEAPDLRIAVVGCRSRPLAASTAAGAMLGAYAEVTEASAASASGKIKLDEALHAARLWPDWVSALNERLPEAARLSIRAGTFIIHNSVGGILDSENFSAIRRALDAHQEPFSEVDPRDIPGLNPWDMARPLQAIFIPGEGSIESDRLLSAYDLVAEASPSIDLIDDSVADLLCFGSRVTGVTTTANSKIEADAVLLANGVSAQEILDKIPSLARRIPRLFAGGGTSLVLDPKWCFGGKEASIVPYVVRTPNRSFGCGLHMMPRGEKYVYVGATNYISAIPWSSPNLSDMHFLIDCAVEQMNQDFVWSQLISWNSGNRPVTVDSSPLMGETSIEGLWIISGTFRDGLHLSPLLGRHFATALLTRDNRFPVLFKPEREPISASRDEVFTQIVKHCQAGYFEHRAVNSTKMGIHWEIPLLLSRAAKQVYEEIGADYVLPAEYFPLVHGNAANIDFFRTYYREVKEAWGR